MKRLYSVSGLKRPRARMVPRLRILVVSEGSVTEGLYISMFVKALHAANVEVRVLGKECGTDPLTVVQFASEKFKEDAGYDLCYCLIDRDTHDQNRFNSALSLGESINRKFSKRQFYVITSFPCIEYWFILHYKYTRSPFVAQGAKSPGDMASIELSKFIPSYSKTSIDEMLPLLERTQQAIENSRRAQDDVQRTGELNPSTRMHELTERLLQESEN